MRARGPLQIIGTSLQALLQLVLSLPPVHVNGDGPTTASENRRTHNNTVGERKRATKRAVLQELVHTINDRDITRIDQLLTKFTYEEVSICYYYYSNISRQFINISYFTEGHRTAIFSPR